MTNVIATDMVYTSIYIDPEGKDRLVVHTPYFESEVPGIVALKSLRLEDVEGCVIGAPAKLIQELEKDLKVFERENSKFKLGDLLEFLEKRKISVRYIQSPDHPRAPKKSQQIRLTKEADDNSHKGDDGSRV